MPACAIFKYLKDMEITWLGHSCFRIKGSHATVITDPYSPTLGYSLGKPTAHIVTVSHQHDDHAYVEGVQGIGGGKPKFITGPGEYEVKDVLIIGVATFHDAEKGAKHGKNTVYLIEIDEVSVCHLGDLGHVLTAEQVEEIDNVDVLLLPVGGMYTINAATAAEVVRQLEPKIVIPMHYKTEAISWDLDPVEKFLKEMGVTPPEPQPKLSLNRANLPVSPQVVLLDYGDLLSPHTRPLL
jgi:L-ascorbate metabolism protein UlaG (beta-lactamase superfamily)